MEKLETSWKLAKESWRVLLLDKELLWFPILSFLTCVIFFGGIGWVIWMSAFVDQPEIPGLVLPRFDAVGLLFFALFATLPSYGVYAIVMFFNSALVTCALIRLHGEDPVLKDGFSHAMRRAGPVFKWSLIAATVGLIFRFFRNRNSLLISLFGGFLSLGWRVATFFVIPVMVSEDKGPVESLKSSVNLIKKTWGEALAFEIGLHLLAIPLVAPAAILFFFGSSMLEANPAIGIPIVLFTMLYIFVVSITMSTMDAIIKAALYLHANGELDGRSFDPELLKEVVKRKNAETPALV